MRTQVDKHCITLASRKREELQKVAKELEVYGYTAVYGKEEPQKPFFLIKLIKDIIKKK